MYYEAFTLSNCATNVCSVHYAALLKSMTSIVFITVLLQYLNGDKNNLNFCQSSVL